MESKDYHKILVLGLDGATYDLLVKWTSEGKFPHLRRLIEGGSFGLLKSVPNLNSAAAWSSFMTGLNPGKHGIFFFHEHINQSFKLKFLNATHREGKEIWEILSEAGKKVGVINVPMTYPSKKVNGCMIAGLDTPSPLSKDFTYPPNLYQELIGQIKTYTIECDMGRKIKQGDMEGSIRAGLETIKQRTAAAKFLLTAYPWDFFMVVFREMDNVQHHFWRYLDPEYPLFDRKSAQKYGNVIFQIYESIDQAVGQIMETIPENTNIVVMSDHGAGPAEFGPPFLNHFLQKTGYLTPAFKGSAGVFLKSKHRVKILIKKFIDLMDTYVEGRFRQFLKLYFFKTLSNLAAERYYPKIDWENSLAYSPLSRPEIWINLKGREPLGIVTKQNYDKLCDEIIVRLYEWRDPQTKNKVIKKAVKRGDVYWGQYVNRSADILVQFHDHLVTGVELPEEYIVKEVKQRFDPHKNHHGFVFGKHADNGIVIASGPDFKAGNLIEGAHIIDLMPTILYLMGLEIPADADGVVLKSIIKDHFLLQNPIRISVKEKDDSSVASHNEYTKSESEIIRQRLTNLGYIE